MKNDNINIIVLGESEKYLNDQRVRWIYENLYSEYKNFEVKVINDKIVIYGDILIPCEYEELPYKIDEIYGNVVIDNIKDPIRYGNLKSLKNFPTVIHGDFKCKMNLNLTSLNDGPEQIYGDFICVGGGLTNIKGMPKYISGNFIVYKNKINDLSPVLESKICGLIDAQYNPCESTDLYKELYKRNKISSL